MASSVRVQRVDYADGLAVALSRARGPAAALAGCAAGPTGRQLVTGRCNVITLPRPDRHSGANGRFGRARDPEAGAVDTCCTMPRFFW